MADDQLRDVVSRMVEAGESEQDIALVIQRMSHDAPEAPKRPEQTLAASDPNYMGAEAEQLGKRGLDRLPAIAAGGAAIAAGPGLILPAIAAGGAGYLGARARGDSRPDAAFTGGVQGALQGGFGGLTKVGGLVARGLMRGGIPKGIQSDFGGREVAQEALDTLAVPGSASSAARVGRLSGEANTARDAAAQTVPTLSGRKLIDGLRKIHGEASAAKMPDRVRAIADRAGEIRREVGTGLDGPAQLARKTILQQEGKAAVNAPNPKMAAVGPQIANAERGAIVSHLRETPGMEDALNLAQKRMGLDRFMQDSLTGNIVNRAGGGLFNMAKSPMGLGVAAHGVNQGSKALDPNLIRALMALLGEGSHDQ